MTATRSSGSQVKGTTVQLLGDVLRHRARATPNRVAVIDERGRTTFAELDRRANQVAQALLADGVAAGDRVAYIGQNAPSFLEVVNGATRAGAVAVPLNNRLSAEELAEIVDHAGAVVVVLGADVEGHADGLRTRPGVRRVIVVEGTSADGYETWRSAQRPDDPNHPMAASDTAVLFYTSGTTGRPKGVMLSGDNLAAAVSASQDMVDFTDTSVAMAPIPFFHIAGFSLAIGAVLHGAALLVQVPTSIEGLVEILVGHGVTHAVLVPTVLQFLVASPAAHSADWSKLEYVLYGASPIPLPVLQQVTEVLGCRFLQSYGKTETTGGVTVLDADDHVPGPEKEDRLTSAGRALPGVSLKVVDPLTLEERAAGEHGEVLVRAPQVMSGYWQDPDATRQVLTPDGWLRTGDGGSLDQDGYLYLHDRLKDMIISGGENVFPAEVESVLTGHPDVLDVAVIGVPSQRWGESPYAVVVLRDGAVLDEQALIDWSRTRLAHFKCPVGVSSTSSLPRNASGKLLKHLVRKALPAQPVTRA